MATSETRRERLVECEQFATANRTGGFSDAVEEFRQRRLHWQAVFPMQIADVEIEVLGRDLEVQQRHALRASELSGGSRSGNATSFSSANP